MQSLFNEYVTPVSPSLYRQGLLVFRETAKLAPSVLQLFSYFCLVVACITPVALRRASAASPLQPATAPQTLPSLGRRTKARHLSSDAVAPWLPPCCHRHHAPVPGCLHTATHHLSSDVATPWLPPRYHLRRPSSSPCPLPIPIDTGQGRLSITSLRRSGAFSVTC